MLNVFVNIDILTIKAPEIYVKLFVRFQGVGLAIQEDLA